MHKLKAVLIQFYRPLFTINLVYSLFLIYKSNEINFIQAIAFKLMGYGLLFGYQSFSKSNTWYYYRNTGYNINLLYIYISIVDLLIYSFLYSLFALLPYAFSHA